MIGGLSEKPPEYTAVKVSAGGGARGDGPRLGIITDYGYQGKDGIPIEGTSDGSPAFKAGLKSGDKIVQLAGKSVKTLQEYMQVMATQKKGETLEVGIVREGKPQTIKVKLE